jgi:anaerobic selenocysteine-containing dehydrogenase
MPTPVKKIAERKKLPVYCNQCVGGPDLMRVEIEDGVATRIESNYDIANEHPGGGRVCVKACGLIQKTYNSNRIKQPMKRTNPKKGREHTRQARAKLREQSRSGYCGRIAEAIGDRGTGAASRHRFRR